MMHTKIDWEGMECEVESERIDAFKSDMIALCNLHGLCFTNSFSGLMVVNLSKYDDDIFKRAFVDESVDHELPASGPYLVGKTD